MAILDRIKPAFVLRLTLGGMYIYSGLDILFHPNSWTWAINSLPVAFKQAIIDPIGKTNFLLGQGVIELILAGIFILWFIPRHWVKWAAFLSAIEMVLILWLVGLDVQTFRDIGLVGASLAVFLTYRYR